MAGSRIGRAPAGALLVALLSLGLTGCGGSAPGETVPELTSQLDRVDAAIAAKDYPQARSAIQALVEETTDARQAGDLTRSQAEPILTAAEELLARLPAETPTPTPTPTPTQTAEPDDGEDEGKGNEGKGNEEEKDEEKDEEKQGEGGGNGSSSENGPDDGHGN